jgi:hypothetical protein
VIPPAREIRARLEERSTDELIAILRERNEDEWRPEVFAIVASILASRGVSVADAADPALEDHGAAEEPFATVASFTSSSEAHVARMALEEAGLSAWVVEGTMGMGDGSRVQVRAGDERAALDILESAPASSTDLPPELAEAPCRSCGANRVRPVFELLERGSPHYNGTDGRPSPRWLFACDACGEKWPDESD